MCMLAYVSTRQACSCVFVLASSHALMHLCLLHLCIYAVSRCACTACTACTKYQSLHASSAHNRAPTHTCTRTPQLLSRKHWDTTPSACARLIRLLRLVCVHLCVCVRARVHAHTPQRTQRHTAHNTGRQEQGPTRSSATLPLASPAPRPAAAAARHQRYGMRVMRVRHERLGIAGSEASHSRYQCTQACMAQVRAARRRRAISPNIRHTVFLTYATLAARHTNNTCEHACGHGLRVASPAPMSARLRGWVGVGSPRACTAV